MPERILGLDISEGSVIAVQVESGLKGYKITACASVPIEGDGGLDDALKRISEKNDLTSDICVSAIPGEHVSYRNLRMPFKDAKKIRQTLPYEVETLVPFPVEDLIIDFSVNDRTDQNEILAVSARKEFISEFLARLQSHDIDPDVLDVRCVPTVSLLLKQEATPENGLFLEIGKLRHTMVLFQSRHVVLIRSFTLDREPIDTSNVDGTEDDHADAKSHVQVETWFESFCEMVQNTIHALGCLSTRKVTLEKVFYTGIGAFYPKTGDLMTRFLGVPAEQIDLSRDRRVNMEKNVAHTWNPALMDNALALSLRNGKQWQGFNFRKDEFETKKSDFWQKKELRRIVIFSAIIICFLAVDIGVDYHFLKKRYGMLDKKITEVFRQTLPDVKKIVDPVKQLQVKVNEVKGSAAPIPGSDSSNKVLDLLKDISERIPKTLDVRMSRMVIDQETVRVSGRTDTFNTVDTIKSGLESSTYFSSVTISSANLDKSKKQIQFELKLQRAR